MSCSQILVTVLLKIPMILHAGQSSRRRRVVESKNQNHVESKNQNESVAETSQHSFRESESILMTVRPRAAGAPTEAAGPAEDAPDGVLGRPPSPQFLCPLVLPPEYGLPPLSTSSNSIFWPRLVP